MVFAIFETKIVSFTKIEQNLLGNMQFDNCLDSEVFGSLYNISSWGMFAKWLLWVSDW